MLTVIVPVYNCEAFLGQCLRSILAQSYKSLQVLLIDDGSSDGSPGICDEFAAIDSRVEVIHQANAGVSAARNKGLALARGEIICFVDADDHVEPGFAQAMFDALQDHDVAVCAYDRFKETSAQAFVLDTPPELRLERLFEHTLCTQLIGGGCCNKAFRTSIIRELGLSFDARIGVGEDMLFLLQYYQRCRRAAYVAEVLYHYRLNENSATEAGFSHGKVTERTASVLLAVDAMAAHVNPDAPYQAEHVAYRKARSSLRLFMQMVMSRTDDALLLDTIQKNMRASLTPYIRSSHARWLEKMVAMALCVSARGMFRVAQMLAGPLSGRLSSYRSG